jgi:predicted transcriptional regulator
MILRALVQETGITEAALAKEIDRDKKMVSQGLGQLCREGLIVKKGKRFFIPDR